MEQQLTTDSPADSKKKIRQIGITCNPRLTLANGQWSVVMSYEEDPDLTQPPISGVVKSNANGKPEFDISNMPPAKGYSDNLKMIFVMGTPTFVGYSGSPTIRWAEEGEHGQSPSPSGYLWFCEADPNQPNGYDPSKPIDPADITPFRSDDGSQIGFEDDQALGGPSYGFCMAMVIEAGNSSAKVYLPIDPVLTSKGGGGNPPFMLKK